MPSNTAAWLTKRPGPLEVKPAPYTSPNENDIVMKNGAVAINPVDWMIRDKPGLLYPWIKTPFILGIDVAGEIVEVGRGVTHLKIGDRVVGHAAGSNKNRNKSAQGAFQLYTVMLAYMVSPIPDTLSFESAAVVPLGASTAACGLFQKDQLALELPNPSRSPKPLGKTVIIWGGATSVGSNAIQLAVAAGYEVITTSSPKNFGYVKKLGANQVFDYNSKTVVLTSNMRSRSCDNEIGPAIYQDFLPKALAEGTFIAAPDPLVVGKGLEYIQAGFETHKKGMSAKKVVVSL